MGATGTHVEKGQGMREEIAKLLGEGRAVVADISRRTGESGAWGWPYVYIAAIRETDGRTWAFVGGYRRDNGSYFNLTYRSDDETVGPGFEEFATREILEALTPTDREYALQWRERAWASLREREAAPPIVKVKPGDTVKLSRPLAFGDGVSRDTFTMIERFTFRAEDGKRVRLPATWKRIGFELVNA